ncbi:hypothetical protein HDF26_003610 [Pedobacter cryoconitis]|nr:hypothetical protein [Pedobacter cryoconitis]
METIIIHIVPDKDVILVFNGVILYYFAFDFLIRLQLQDLPILAIAPYLHLNIPKHKLVSFLNIRALFSGFNILPLLIFFPFILLKINHVHGLFAGLMYLLAIFSLMLLNNYSALYFKRLSAQNFRIGLYGFLFLCVIGLLEYFNFSSIASLSNIIFHTLILHPLTGIIFPILAMAIISWNSMFLKKNLYLEELKSETQKKTGTDFLYLDKLGETGDLLALDIKLILRNKRSRSTVTKSLLFIFYGLLFYKQKVLDTNQFWILIFPAAFMTGNMIMLYGQFMFGWQSAEFDGLLSGKINMKIFFKAKFLLFTLSSTILTAVVSLYGLISWKILAIQFAMYFYNIGITSVIVLFFATRNYSALDLSKGSTMNWQGVTASKMIMTLPLFLSPYIIYLPLSLIINPYWGLAGLTIAGLTGLFTQDYWIEFLFKEFTKRKYKIAEGFRKH